MPRKDLVYKQIFIFSHILPHFPILIYTYTSSFLSSFSYAVSLLIYLNLTYFTLLLLLLLLSHCLFMTSQNAYHRF